MIDVIRLSRIFDLTRTTIQMYNSMNRIEWEKSTVRHMIELWCRKKHSEKELCGMQRITDESAIYIFSNKINTY